MARGQKIPVVSEKKVSFQGYFNIKDTYKFIKDYLEDTRHYGVAEKDLDEKSLDGSRKITSKNDATAQYNDYYAINIRYILDMSGKEVDIEVGGKKKKFVNGTANLTVNAYVIPDYLEKRDVGAIGEFLGKIYDKFLGKSELTECQEKAAEDVSGLLTEFKKNMNSKLK